MIPFDSDNYISATYTNGERDTICVLFKDSDTHCDFYLPVLEEDLSYKKLLSIITLDDLEENTKQRTKEERIIFKKMVRQIAEEDGLIYKESDRSVTPQLLINVLNETEEETNKEELFAFKLSIFENEKVKESEDSETKKEIRQAKTFKDAIKAYLNII